MNVHAQNVSHKYNNKQRNHRNMNISLSNAKLQQVLEICKVKAIDLTRAYVTDSTGLSHALCPSPARGCMTCGRQTLSTSYIA